MGRPRTAIGAITFIHSVWSKHESTVGYSSNRTKIVLWKRMWSKFLYVIRNLLPSSFIILEGSYGYSHMKVSFIYYKGTRGYDVLNLCFVRATNKTTISRHVPGSLTTWLTSAFAVNGDHGFGLLLSPLSVSWQAMQKHSTSGTLMSQ